MDHLRRYVHEERHEAERYDSARQRLPAEDGSA
jgi:hypothetical protein